jgi:hypothetical protein
MRTVTCHVAAARGKANRATGAGSRRINISSTWYSYTLSLSARYGFGMSHRSSRKKRLRNATCQMRNPTLRTPPPPFLPKKIPPWPTSKQCMCGRIPNLGAMERNNSENLTSSLEDLQPHLSLCSTAVFPVSSSIEANFYDMAWLESGLCLFASRSAPPAVLLARRFAFSRSCSSLAARLASLSLRSFSRRRALDSNSCQSP